MNRTSYKSSITCSDNASLCFTRQHKKLIEGTFCSTLGKFESENDYNYNVRNNEAHTQPTNRNLMVSIESISSMSFILQNCKCCMKNNLFLLHDLQKFVHLFYSSIVLANCTLGKKIVHVYIFKKKINCLPQRLY